jgi:uncharacterized membrane protein YqjE
MEQSTTSLGQLAGTTKDLARRLAIIGENRLELLAVEVQEERQRLLRALLLALGAMVFGLLGGMTLTAAIVILLRACSPATVLLALTVLYAGAGLGLYWRLMGLLRTWEILAASLDQLRKDRACLEKIFE